jgi:hypothetical protein
MTSFLVTLPEMTMFLPCSTWTFARASLGLGALKRVVRSCWARSCVMLNAGRPEREGGLTYMSLSINAPDVHKILGAVVTNVGVDREISGGGSGDKVTLVFCENGAGGGSGCRGEVAKMKRRPEGECTGAEGGHGG